MPVYHYRGTECDHEFEVRQSFSDDPITICEVCSKPVRRVIHASPVVFKGSGWYITDSKPTSDEVGGVQDVKKKPETAAKGNAEPETTSSTPAATEKPAAATSKAE